MQIFSVCPLSELRQTRFTNCLSTLNFSDVYYFRINLFLRFRKWNDEFYALRGRNGTRGATRVQQRRGRNKGKICKMIRVANSIASELEDWMRSPAKENEHQTTKTWRRRKAIRMTEAVTMAIPARDACEENIESSSITFLQNSLRRMHLDTPCRGLLHHMS